MKITRNNSFKTEIVEIADNLEYAFKDAMMPGAYEYDKTKEKLSLMIERQNSMLAKLVDILHDKSIISTYGIEHILNAAGNDEYKIEE